MRNRDNDLAKKLEERSDALRELAKHVWLVAEGREALMAAADLYEARAANLRASRVAVG